jgi:hypothetical protein
MRKKVLAALGCLGVIVATLIGKGIGQQAGGEIESHQVV